MKLFRLVSISLILLLAASAEFAPALADSPAKDDDLQGTFFSDDVQLSVKSGQVSTVERKEDITPGAAPIVTAKIEAIGPPPASHVLDEARVFNAEQLARISTLLKDPSHGLEFYVTAHTLLPDESLESYAVRVRDAWAQTDKCVVISYQRGSQIMTMCSSDGIYRYVPKPALARSYEVAYEAASEHTDAAERLEVAARIFIGDVSGKIRHIQANDRIFDRGTTKLVVAFFSALAVAGGIGLLMARAQKKSVTKSQTTYQFPLLDLPRRFGAPFGGGVIAEVVFDRPDSAN